MFSSNSKLDRKNFKREPCAVLTVRSVKKVFVSKERRF